MALKPVTYRCTDCGHEFEAGPGPVTGGALHALPGGGVVQGACPACGGLYVGELRWFVVQCTSQAEAAVADKIASLGHLVLFLHHLVQPRRLNRLSRKQRQKAQEAPGPLLRRPVLPGYVIAGLTPPMDFYGISNTPGVAQVLANENGPAALPIAEVDRLRAWGDADGVVSMPDSGGTKRPLLAPESIVRIKSGPFQGFTGPVVRDDGKLVRVEAEIFGRMSPVDLAIEDLEVIRRAA